VQHRGRRLRSVGLVREGSSGARTNPPAPQISTTRCAMSLACHRRIRLA
jgi:hypothetical protein